MTRLQFAYEENKVYCIDYSIHSFLQMYISIVLDKYV